MRSPTVTEERVMDAAHAQKKVWFITGASRGLGRSFAEAALGRGDEVIASAREVGSLGALVTAHGGGKLLARTLDVTDRTAAFAAVAAGVERFGRIDVVVNNAGYGLFGAVEEISPEQLRAQLEVNLFGVLHVTQAALPVLRAQRAGHIVQVSTIGGVAAFPNLGGYHASKWAVEGLTESLAQEVAGFGVRVTLVEPGPYATDWMGRSAHHATPLDAYVGLRAALHTQYTQHPPDLGDPRAAAAALLKLVDAPSPPRRVFFGALPTRLVPQLYQERLATWAQWEALSLEAQGVGR
jgi:NAD(P)-dependent dehydrogenase (short-subunit alcohol dehydrogenase family)